MVFPALIWAAFRFGPPGATLSIAIAAGVAIGVTAHDVGPFFKQPIDHRTLSTQLYIAVAALTTLFLSAIVSERERSSVAARRGEAARGRAGGGGAAPDRPRSARLGLPGVVLDRSAHPHRSEGAGAGGREPVGTARAMPSARSGSSTRSAQSEMRALIFELGRDPVEDGLGAALAEHASRARRHGTGSTIDVHAPDGRLPLSRARRDAALRHRARGARQRRSSTPARARRAVRVEAPPGQVLVEIRDDGRGFDPAARHPGSLRPRVDAQPRSRDRRAPDDHERAGTRHRRPRRGSAPETKGVADERLSETRGSACSWSTITRSCAAACWRSSTASPTSRSSAMPTEARRRSTCSRGWTRRGGGPTSSSWTSRWQPLDGIESTRRIRALYDDVEVVALTSFAEEERVHAALEAGASGYLLKDADADEVAAAVRAAHRGELQLDPAVARRLMSSLRAGPRRDLTAELTPRELEVLRLVGRGQGQQGRSPPSCRSASERPGPTCRTSCASSASARAPRPPCGPFAKASRA